MSDITFNTTVTYSKALHGHHSNIFFICSEQPSLRKQMDFTLFFKITRYNLNESVLFLWDGINFSFRTLYLVFIGDLFLLFNILKSSTILLEKSW